VKRSFRSQGNWTIIPGAFYWNDPTS